MEEDREERIRGEMIENIMIKLGWYSEDITYTNKEVKMWFKEGQEIEDKELNNIIMIALNETKESKEIKDSSIRTENGK